MPRRAFRSTWRCSWSPSFDLPEPRSERQDSKNVLALKVVIVRQDLLGGHSGAEQFKYDLDGVPQVTDARFAMADVWVDGDAFEQCVSRLGDLHSHECLH